MTVSFKGFPHLLTTLAGESDPAIQSGGAAFAAATSFESECMSSMFDDVSKADIFFADESGQAHSKRLALSLIGSFTVYISLFHVLLISLRANC